MTADSRFMKRLYRLNDFSRLIRDFFISLPDMRGARRKGLISSQFGERIMMAVTEVNGCRYCSYFHTQVSLKAGLDLEEIRHTLAGDFNQAPAEELPALLFAQHYAEYAGIPEPEMMDGLFKTYGQEKGGAIIGYIRAIMVGNAWGNALDSLRFRVKGKPNPEMTLGQEMGILIGPLVLMPYLTIGKLLGFTI